MYQRYRRKGTYNAYIGTYVLATSCRVALQDAAQRAGFDLEAADFADCEP
jgi:hypothetical protein